MKKVLVAGDLLLDIYIYGTVERISPEAPIPIFDKKSEKIILGGAANVASNIASLMEDIEIHYFGFYSHSTFGLFKKNKIIPIGHFLRDEQILTKTRFCCNCYQLLRMDNFKRYDVDDCKKINEVYFNLEQYDLIVVSDYNKGTLEGCNFYNQLIKSNVPAIVENKKFKIKGFGKNVIFKCNDKEFKKDYFINEKELINEIVVTQGENGYKLIKANKQFPAISLESEVVDVCGAGDCFTAGMAVNFLENEDFNAEKMAEFGNKVSAEKVKRFGTVAVKREWLD